MPKNKRPSHNASRKSAPQPQVKEEQQSTELCALALDLAHGVADADIVSTETRADLAQKTLEFQRQLRRLLAQNKDEVLYGAIDLAHEESVEAYRYLRNAIEESAANLLVHREDGPEMELDAFAIPLFVHSQGGLDPAADFQDGEAYDALVASFGKAGLESKHAKVGLVSHAYDMSQMERISYGQLQAMVREAAQSLGGKKMAAAPALERSMASGWSATSFGPEDSAVELRFLVGFAMKRADDPFYKAPANEKAADDYYAQRAERYQQWTEDYAPLVARCLGRGRGADTQLSLNFLYQDLFFGARTLAQSEYAMLGLLSELNAVLSEHAPEQLAAVISPSDEDDEMALQVQLHAGGVDGPVLATAYKPLDAAADVALAIDDLRDALVSLGITDLGLSDGPSS